MKVNVYIYTYIMEKVEIYVGDEVELFNGTNGSIKELNINYTFVLSNGEIYHKMNIKKINGFKVYPKDIIFPHLIN